MDYVFLFDVDGTLTVPRQPMTADFAEVFEGFCERNPVFLVSGSDLPKIREQVPERIMEKVTGSFVCSAAEFWVDDHLVYRAEHAFPAALTTALEHMVDSSPYPIRCGNHIEFRTGMINMSVVGRNATPDQRKAYHRWDRSNGERDRFLALLGESFPQYEVSAGGEISIDIVPRGWNKSRAMVEVKQRYPECAIAFFGDRMGPGGNDRPLAEALRLDAPRHQIVEVRDYQETLAHLVRFDRAVARGRQLAG